MPCFGMLDFGGTHFTQPPSPPKHVKRNIKKSKMAKASRRNNRRH